MTLTVKEYNEFTHTDLNAEISARINTVDDNGADALIEQIEDLIYVKYAFDYGFKGITERSTEHQIKCYKKAVIYQIMYDLQNGSLWNDSGYDIGTGLIVNPTELRKIGIPEHVHKWMKLGGMANLRRG